MPFNPNSLAANIALKDPAVGSKTVPLFGQYLSNSHLYRSIGFSVGCPNVLGLRRLMTDSADRVVPSLPVATLRPLAVSATRVEHA